MKVQGKQGCRPCLRSVKNCKSPNRCRHAKTGWLMSVQALYRSSSPSVIRHGLGSVGRLFVEESLQKVTSNKFKDIISLPVGWDLHCNQSFKCVSHWQRLFKLVCLLALADVRGLIPRNDKDIFKKLQEWWGKVNVWGLEVVRTACQFLLCTID